MSTAAIKIEHTENHESELKALSEAIYQSQAVIEYDMKGTIINANQNFLKLMNYELPDLLERNHSLFCEAEYASGLEYRQYWEKLKKGESLTAEFKRFGKNGNEVWVVSSCTPVKDEHGVPFKVLDIVTDISAVKAELKVRTDIMNLTSIVTEADLRGDIISMNEKYVEISKYTREELMGSPHSITRHPDMPKEVFHEMWATIGRGKMFRGIVKNKAKDGSPYYVDAVIAPIMGDNGKPKKYLGVRYDITANEIERQNMKGVIRAIDGSFAYLEFDIDGYVLNSNKIFQDLMEYDPAELKGKHHKAFCDHSFAQSNDYSQFWGDLNSGLSKNGIFKRTTRSGREVWLQAVYAPVTDETGRVVKLVMIATDFTPLRTMMETMGETAAELAKNAVILKDDALQMSENAKKTSVDTGMAASSSEHLASGVQSVAASTEQMVASIREISRSSHESAEMSRITLSHAQETNKTIQKLGSSSQEIGNVIKVISSIAQQTNLLALNATIEAARAGEAGKGFAVVANEVKELAKQTARATEDITARIGLIQKDTTSAVDAIGGISKAMEKLNDISGAIAAAIEQQTATTNEVSRVIGESKRGVENIAQTIKEVSGAAIQSSQKCENTLKSSDVLAALAEKLRALVHQFQK
jgi:methyl-accepting chemotaxis protein